MKQFLTAVILTFIVSQLLGQSHFSADGQQIKTGIATKTYNFSYLFQDSLNLYFTDSILTLTNPQETIVKTIHYSKPNKANPIKIQYFKTDGRDSISKHFSGDKLIMIYETRYDSLDRIIYYAMKDLNADTSYDRGFEWTYDYRDSLTTTQKYLIQTVFVDDAYGDKRFHFRVISQYDDKNRKIKETRESKNNDPFAQITTYVYDDKDRLIEERVNTAGIESTIPKNTEHSNTLCDQVNRMEISANNFNDIEKLTRTLLSKNKELLTTDMCENLFYKYISEDNQTELKLIKRKPYWCEGRRVTFTITQRK